MNPYESPATESDRPRSYADWPRRIAIVMLTVFACGFALQWGSIALRAYGYSGLSDFLMPRFGWGGAADGMWPSIFLGMWLWQRSRIGLFAAGGMCFFVVFTQAAQLLSKGTTGTVENAFHDRLHESWAFAVAPMALAGVICLVLGFKALSLPANDANTRG